MRTIALAIALLSAAVGAQVKKPYEIKLTPKQEIALVGGNIELRLTVNVLKDTNVLAMLLSGYEFDTQIDGKKGPTVVSKVPGRVKLAANTTITRTITIPVDRVLGGKGGSKMQRVSLTWPGLIGVNTAVSIAPDMSKISLGDLNLAKTKVALVTTEGTMVVKFRADKAPGHVKNFIKLSKEGFYNGTHFHRVLKGFMIQGGCPYSKKGSKGTPGTGDPGYKIKAEFNDIKHVRGVLSMARSQDPNSGGCQFFVMHARAAHLDGKYTAFGELESGFEVLDKIATADVFNQSQPVKPIYVKAALIYPVFKEGK